MSLEQYLDQLADNLSHISLLKMKKECVRLKSIPRSVLATCRNARSLLHELAKQSPTDLHSLLRCLEEGDLANQCLIFTSSADIRNVQRREQSKDIPPEDDPPAYETLDIYVDNEILSLYAGKAMLHWKPFARELGFTNTEIETITIDNCGSKEQVTEMLRKWKMRKGQNALTYDLSQAFDRCLKK